MSKTDSFQHESADDSPGFLLWKLTTLWQEKLTGVFTSFGITQTQYAILASLLWFEKNDEPPTQAHLVEHAKIEKMTLSKAIRKLEEARLVCRMPSATDTRAIQVRFTTEGYELIGRAILAVEQADDVFFSALPQRQLASWKRLTISLMEGELP